MKDMNGLQSFRQFFSPFPNLVNHVNPVKKFPCFMSFMFLLSKIWYAFSALRRSHCQNGTESASLDAWPST